MEIPLRPATGLIQPATAGSGASPAPAEPEAESAPRQRGKTFIEEDVVSVIARVATQEVPGVHHIGESSLRAIVSRLGRHHGVDAEVGLHEAAVDVEIVVEFGYPIRHVAEDVRERIIEMVESMTSRRVVEVNVFVVDVHLPKAERKSRRQLE